MDQLPLEIKYIIAKYVGELEDRSKESLRTLSLVNRHWNRISIPFLYEHLIVRLREEANDTCQWLALPYARTILKHVKRLSIVVENRVSPRIYREEIRARVSRRIRQSFKCLPPSRDHGEELGNTFIPVVGDYEYSGRDWTPVLNMIRQIPLLRNVDLFVRKGGPVELCETISQYHPTCRVSIFTTWPSEGKFTPESIIQRAWLLSSMLYAVHVTCPEFPHSRNFIEHPDRVLQSMILLAPHIKELALQRSRNGYKLSAWRFSEVVKVEGTTSEKPPAKLKTLSWPLDSEITAGQFEDWQIITDFSLLESWTVGCIGDSALLQTIVDIHPFQRLTRLTLALFPPLGDHDSLEFWQAADSMFQSLPSITYLALFGKFLSTFLANSVLPRHGSTLHELKLHGYTQRGDQELQRLQTRGQIGPIFSTHDILQLADRCSSLQKLLICVQRYRGLETDMWTALGRFPRLKELNLLLNCLPQTDANRMPIPPRDLSDFEMSTLTFRPIDNIECRRWFIRDCMINCAIGESLAKEFFTRIHACQHEKSLMKLVIHPLIGQSNQYSCFSPGATRAFIGTYFFNELAFIWKVERDFMSVLHAESEKIPTSSISKDPFPDEKLEILQSI